MEYTGALFGKIGGKYIPLKMSSSDVDELLEALIDATDNCLWRSDSEYPLSTEESARIYQKAMTAIAKSKGGK